MLKSFLIGRVRAWAGPLVVSVVVHQLVQAALRVDTALYGL
jgi:hypothetical protein